MSWWESDPRYCQPGWTVIVDESGARFVRQIERKRRKPSRALRFAELQPGAILVHRQKWQRTVYESPKIEGLANDNQRDEKGVAVGFAIVEDRWFDPVAGQRDPTSGEMASVRGVDLGRYPFPTKYAHTLRGLAMQGYDYATPEQAERVRHHLRLCDAVDENEVAPIGRGKRGRRAYAAAPL